MTTRRRLSLLGALLVGAAIGLPAQAIRGKVVEAGNGRPVSGAIVEVRDQGPGIPPEYKNQLFEKFKQVEGISSTKLKGTGLGLAICKAIVQGHNGEIGVESEVGQGTTFWFNIPKAISLISVAETVPA